MRLDVVERGNQSWRIAGLLTMRKSDGEGTRNQHLGELCGERHTTQLVHAAVNHDP